RRRDEARQRAEACIRVLVVPAAVLRGPEGEAAVTAAAGALLAAGRRAEHMELVAVIRRDLRVVGGVREARRAAVVDVAGLVDLEKRLGLVALVIGRDGRRELKSLRRSRGERRL